MHPVHEEWVLRCIDAHGGEVPRRELLPYWSATFGLSAKVLQRTLGRLAEQKRINPMRKGDTTVSRAS